MISRRDAVKLGAAAGIALPAISRRPAFATQVATPSAVPGPPRGPSLDAPIIVKWTYESGAEHGGVSVIENDVAYGGAQGTSVFALDTETGRELWRNDLVGGYLSPMIDEGLTIISSSTGDLIALDAATGAEQWRFETGSRALPSVVSDETVYFGAENGAFYALDTTTGAEKWKFQSGHTNHPFDIRILVENTTAYVTGGASVMYALDTETGDQKWRFGTESYWLNNPVLEGGVLYFTSTEGIHALDPETGTQRWIVPMDAQRSSGPILDNGVMYVGIGDGPAYAIDAATGEVIWQIFPGGYGATSMAVDADTVTFDVATGGQMFPYYNLHGVDKLTGGQLWRSEDIWNTMWPAVAGDGTMVVGETHAKATDAPHPLYALDTSTGAEIWRIEKVGGFPSTPMFFNGNVFVSTRPGNIYCIGNLSPAVLSTDVSLLGAPSSNAIQRGTANAGDVISNIGTRDSSSGEEWVEVTIEGVMGWIPMDAIDPATLPPEGEIEYVYVP